MITVEIWSDVLCPFCFIGYRNLQRALKEYTGAEKVRINWHSFLLNPDMKTDLNLDAATALARAKGQSVAWAQQVQQQVTDMGLPAGINFQFEKSVVASSLRAHHLIQLAKKHRKANVVEEALFEAYFEKGLNIDSDAVLVAIGTAAGLAEADVRGALEDPQLTAAIESDLYQARTMGIQGVPFFLFNEKYVIRGAQPVEVFKQVLEQVEQDFAGEAGSTSVHPGTSCDTDSKTC